MPDTVKTGRWKQRRRTREDLLHATARLLKLGRKPSLEEVADAAQVSRATAYRYFPSVEALLVEAALDVAVPEPDELFAENQSADPVQRLEQVDGALHAMIAQNEVPLRLMLANALQQRAKGVEDGDLPVRQDRRTPLIKAALAPARGEFEPADLETLTAALALIVGTEAMVVFRDVLQLDDAQAQKVRRWAIRALVEAARSKPQGT
ncbi:TetR/AcrR family transcriptional regulator [Oleomonas cavernae]|uniref:TetR/AcrR family transcriptional regulator n=1 Tax=Oleomonas cavernae TaxID=2320859 RepID=A0A418VU25_9PROT|nr:TetR/AcrR family transcriptional regulator [Oleomonas cavernae]RJF80668.1 TetR/AcrR family transcriptional regulator [Oleomonas cavernae]